MWWGLSAVALTLGALGVLIDARWTRLPGGVSPIRIGLGLGVSLLAVVFAGALIQIEVLPPPEQRGIGVEVDDLGPLRLDRGLDRGLTLSMAVEVRDCDEPVEVQLTLAPTAEFWIDNHEALAARATVRFAIPDDLPAEASVGDVLRGLDAWTGTDGLAPFVTTAPAVRTDLQLAATATKAAYATFVAVDVPRWGVTFQPLTIRFLADWTHHRSFLGGCYVSLPAVAGLPTVLSSAQLAGKTFASPSALPRDTINIFKVSSEEASLYAYYNEAFEVTRGVTSLKLVDHTLQEGASFPAPNANFGGAPAWTCRSSIPDDIHYSDRQPGDDAGDVYALLEGLKVDGTTSLSDRRQRQILRQRTCASFVAIEAASAGIRRDLLLIAVGTTIALGIELLLSGVRRRRRGPAPLVLPADPATRAGD